ILSLTRAWQETGNGAYLTQAQALIDYAAKHQDPRRGTYVEIHGSASHPGAQSFIDGILAVALRRYQIATGDVASGKLIVNAVESVFAESHDYCKTTTDPTGATIFYEYSPNPYLRGGDISEPPASAFNVPVISSAAYASTLTGDGGQAAIANGSWA